MNKYENITLDELKTIFKEELMQKVEHKIIEKENYEFLKKWIDKAEDKQEVLAIASMGTTYNKTGFTFNTVLEHPMGDDIYYFKKNDKLSFNAKKENGITHKLIIGDNYHALLNLMVEYKNAIDVIYIDPPYGKDNMGEFADTNYENDISRDNLISMLYPRLQLAKQLLKEEGIIFCSIDDRNQAYVKGLFDEVFGEENFIACMPRRTKSSGKTTNKISSNHDYVLVYAKSKNESLIIGIQHNDEGFKYEDEYVNERGKYKLNQTLDYDSLSYSPSLDYPIEIEGHTLYPGGDYEKYKKRQNGIYKRADWAWRWSKDLFEFGLNNGFIVVKKGKDGMPRIYTKTYLNAKIQKNETTGYEVVIEERNKPLSSIEFIESKYSNDNAKKDLMKIFENSKFDYPKPVELVKMLLNIYDNKKAIILDFFAGSGTTGQAVMELNKDGGKRQFILCTNNEITNTTPNGVAYDVTTKRLKRVMTGKCYDGSSDFDWIKNNEPYGDGLNVIDIDKVYNAELEEGKTAFDVIDERLYGENKFQNIEEKIVWVCKNFEHTQRYEKKSNKEEK